MSSNAHVFFMRTAPPSVPALQIFIEHDFWNMNIAVEPSTWREVRECRTEEVGPQRFRLRKQLEGTYVLVRGMSYIHEHEKASTEHRTATPKPKPRTRTRTQALRQSRGSKHQLLIARVRAASQLYDLSRQRTSRTAVHNAR